MSARKVYRSATHLIIDRFLAVRKNGETRVTVGPPALRADEISVALQLKIPRAFFEKPQLQAKIEVPANVEPPNISVEVQDGIAKAIRDATGYPVTLTVSSPDGAKPA